jgi:hypothetical protein
MSLSNLKRHLPWTPRPATAPHPPASSVEQGPQVWPHAEEDRSAAEAEDDFEGEGWSFWGV